jgi:CBS domain-containing protein
MAETAKRSLENPEDPFSLPKHPRVEEQQQTVQPSGASSFVYSTSDALIRLLLKTKAEEFAIEGPAEKTPIFVCDRKDKVVDVWKGLIKHNFLSVPVLLREENRYFGFLDMADILRYIVNHFGEDDKGKDKDFWDLVKEEEKFQTKTVGDLMTYPLSRRNPFHPLHRGYSAMAVVEPLAREPQLHRIPVIDPDTKQMFNLVTQSQVLRWLHKHLDIMGTIKHKAVGDCPSVMKPVIHVTEGSDTLKAFQTMFDDNISGVAVVDDSGKLTNTLSIRDLKTIGTDARLFWRLRQTVHNFIRKVRHEGVGERPRSVVFATRDDTLAKVIQEMVDHKIHRVFVVDDRHTKKPVGIVSIRDVLLEILGG